MSLSLVKLFVPGIYLVLLFGSTPCHENSCNLPNINGLLMSRVAICLVASENSQTWWITTTSSFHWRHLRHTTWKNSAPRTLTSNAATAAQCSIKASKMHEPNWVPRYCWHCFGCYHSSSKEKWQGYSVSFYSQPMLICHTKREKFVILKWYIPYHSFEAGTNILGPYSKCRSTVFSQASLVWR